MLAHRKRVHILQLVHRQFRKDMAGKNFEEDVATGSCTMLTLSPSLTRMSYTTQRVRIEGYGRIHN